METMKRNTKTNIKTGITKHKHSSPQSCRSSLQRQEVPEGESQEGTCDDQLSVAVLVRRCWWWGWWKGAPWERVRLLFKYGEGAIQGEQSYVVPPFHLEDMEGRGIWMGGNFFCVCCIFMKSPQKSCQKNFEGYFVRLDFWAKVALSGPK